MSHFPQPFRSALPGPLCAWTITAQRTETQKRKAPNHTTVLFVVRFSANQTFYPNIKWSIHITSHTSAKNTVWPLSSWSGSKDTDKHTVEGAPSTVLNMEGPSPSWNPCKAIRAATLERNHTPVLPVVVFSLSQVLWGGTMDSQSRETLVLGLLSLSSPFGFVSVKI